MEKRFLAVWMWLCEGKLKVKIDYFRLQSVFQKRACLSSLWINVPAFRRPLNAIIKEEINESKFRSYLDRSVANHIIDPVKKTKLGSLR